MSKERFRSAEELTARRYRRGADWSFFETGKCKQVKAPFRANVQYQLAKLPTLAQIHHYIIMNERTIIISPSIIWWFEKYGTRNERMKAKAAMSRVYYPHEFDPNVLAPPSEEFQVAEEILSAILKLGIIKDLPRYTHHLMETYAAAERTGNIYIAERICKALDLNYTIYK